MFSSESIPLETYDWVLTHDPRCEGCGRSMVDRFGGSGETELCESCEANWRRYFDAHNGAVEVSGEAA